MRIVAVVAALVSWLSSTTADAQPKPPDPIAGRLFLEGRALYDQGKFIEACVLFDKSYELDPAPGTGLNVAECADRDGKPRAAWLLYIAAAQEWERIGDDRAKFAQSRADQLAPKLATIAVNVAKHRRTGLAIKIGGRDLAPAARIVERVEPGKIVITASAPDRETFSTTIDAGLGLEYDIDVPALKRLPGSKGTDDDEETPRRGWGPWHTIATVSGGVCVVSIGAVIVTWMQIKDAEEELEVFDPAERDRLIAKGERAERWNRIATVTAAVSGIAVGVALTKIILDTRKAKDVAGLPRRSSSRFAVTPAITPSGVGASLELHW